MKKEGVFLIILFLISIFFVSTITGESVPRGDAVTGESITGKASSRPFGVSINVSEEVEDPVVTVSSPENRTYNFSIGNIYSLGLNASANFNVNTWRYTHRDLKHNSIIRENQIFTPNTIINAARWSNQILVYANDGSADYNSSVVFFVYVPNSSPRISGIPDEIYLCENNYSEYIFNMSDDDEESLDLSLSPTNPFYVTSLYSINYTVTASEIFSGILRKDKVGKYSETISVSDGVYADSKKTNITVIEINNIPSVSNIGVQTIWTRGEDNNFYKKLGVNDVEDGTQDSGNLTFNLTFLSGNNIFNISSNGIMNYTSSGNDMGIYNIMACVNDNELSSPHENISLCGQDGSAITVCQNFSLTITNENRAPNITFYSPLELSFSANSTDTLLFTINKSDEDKTIPDGYWYVDGIMKKYHGFMIENSLNSYSESFSFVFGCGVSGNHSVQVVITDGLINNSIQWNISLVDVACSVLSSSGGSGGGGGSGAGCREKWGCDEWSVCQNLEKSFNLKIMDKEDYGKILTKCNLYNWNKDDCGYQIKSCVDVNLCNTSLKMPELIQECEFTIQPSCNDGIKNCHDVFPFALSPDSSSFTTSAPTCELFVDCGGPCGSCPTCSDKIQNQGEEEIDCGGPCPVKCVEKPVVWYRNRIVSILLMAVFILLIVIILKSIKVYSMIRRISGKR